MDGWMDGRTDGRTDEVDSLSAPPCEQTSCRCLGTAILEFGVVSLGGKGLPWGHGICTQAHTVERARHGSRQGLQFNASANL